MRRPRPPGAPRARRRPARPAPAGNGPRALLWRYRRVLLLVAVLGIGAVGGALLVLAQVPLPPDRPEAQTTFLTDATGHRLASIDAGENRVSVKLDDVPPVVIDAVLATEDKNFFTHSGVDPFGIMRATWADVRGRGSLQGGSTITQQYAKNAYVGNERSLWRKLKEAVIAVKLERRYDKREILERYLNAIYFGRGAYGVQAASRAYFAKDVGRLELREAAYLAGLIRSPESADAVKAPTVAKARRSRTLAAMVRAGKITDTERGAVEAVPLTDYVTDRRRAQQQQVVLEEKGTAYFVEYVRQLLVKKFGEAAVVGGGLRVKTTLNLQQQTQAYDAVYGLLDRADDPSGALVAVDDRGAITAMVGGRDYATSKVNLALGREGGGHGRQAGSTFKPFLLAETVRRGYTVESAYPGPAEITLRKANNGKDWPVHNYDDQDFGDSVNLIDATRQSVNTVYAQLVLDIGAGAMADMARDLGVTAPLQPVNSLVLGTSDVSVLDMARAFSTFANRGERAETFALLEVTTADGRVLERASPDRTRVLERRQADIVNFCLRQAVERGTGTAARFGKPMAGKTGTTQDYGDAWFVGYTPKLTAAVWMGYPEGNSHPMTSVRGRKVTGGSFPAQIFKRFMAAATKGMSTGSFPSVSDFDGKVLKGARSTFSTDTTTTTLAGDASTTSSTERGTTTTTTAPTSTTYREIHPSSTSTSSSTSSTSTTGTTEPDRQPG
ncbi:MAG TPA: transglycosylase domain-containing protein [Acidimicrobiales bacterium]|nr:transglycosylase domain-containing protein [Acidimicrobiales bacterium]